MFSEAWYTPQRANKDEGRIRKGNEEALKDRPKDFQLL